MNFLAHIYLSGENDQLMVGNFIGDGIKGNHFDHLPPGMISGIRLHRIIDSFTDKHPVFLESCRMIRPKMGKFAGVIADMFYDHFLASAWNQYHLESIEDFTIRKYMVINDYYEILPPRFQKMTQYMTRENWLKSYARISNVEKALLGMTNRFNLPVHLPDAIEILLKNYIVLQAQFNLFFPEIISASNDFMIENGFNPLDNLIKIPKTL